MIGIVNRADLERTALASMRIGQILLEAELITAKQLSDGLEYGTAKSIFLGRVMKLLKYAQEEDIERALETQKLIKRGLSPVLAISALKRACKEKISMDQALQDEHLDTIGAPEEAGAAKAAKAASIELDNDITPETLIKNGDKLLIQDCCTLALAQYRRAQTTLEQSLGADHIDLAPVLVRLGNTYLAANSFDKAKEAYEKVLAIRTKSLAEDDPQLAHAHESLADLYNAQGDLELAVKEFLAALDILEQRLPGQLSAYSAILKKLTKVAHGAKPRDGKTLPVGEILRMAGLLSERELQTALRMSKQTSLPLGIVLRENCMIGDRELQSALKAQFCVTQGVLSEKLAIELLTRASRRDISLERLLHEAGVLVTDQEKFEVYRQIASELDKLVGAESSAVNSQQELAPIAYKLGTLYEQVKDQPQAEVYYSRALTIWGSTISGDLTVAKACISLARIFQDQKRHEEAVPMLQKALEHRQHALGNNHDDTIETLEDLTELQIELRHGNGALKSAQQAIAAREELGQDGATILRSVVLMGDALALLEQFDGAQAAYNRAMALARTGENQSTATLAAVMEKLGDLNTKQDKTKVAMPLYKGALMLLESAGKKDGQNLESLKSKIAKLESN